MVFESLDPKLSMILLPEGFNILNFFKNSFILHFCDFQHTFIKYTNFNNFLTNYKFLNKLQNTNYCISASFTPSSLKVELRCYA